MALTLTATLLISFNSWAGDVCTQKTGSLNYRSATTVGNTAVIRSPYLLLDNGPVNLTAHLSGIGICRALGFKGGQSTDAIRLHNLTMVASYSDEGVLESVSRQQDVWVTNILTCQK